MSNKPFSLSSSQYVFVIYKTQIGIGILTIPHYLFLSSGIDGWITIIFGWLVSVIISFLIINTLEKHPNETLFDLLPKYFGKWLGKMILFCWILYTLFAASYVFMYSIFLIKVWVLPNTDPILLGLLFLVPIYQITKHSLPMISRYPIILITAHNGLWLNLLPIMKDGWVPIFKSTPLTSLSFLGFEMAYLLYPRLQNKKFAYKGIFIANTMNAIVLIMVTILSFVRLSEAELSYAIWPTLDLIKLIRFPFLERLEIIFISAYIIILFMTVIPYLYMGLTGTLQLFPKTIKMKPVLAVVLLIWMIILFFPVIGFQPIIYFKRWFSNLGYIFAFLFPIFLWLYSKVFWANRKGAAKG